jgi:hypothetical protein
MRAACISRMSVVEVFPRMRGIYPHSPTRNAHKLLATD